MDPLREMTTKDDAGTRHTIPRKIQVEAIEEWVRRGRGDLNYSALGYTLDRAMGEVWQGNWNFGRAADRIVQRLREAGWIEKIPGSRGWRLTEAGHRAVENDLVWRDETAEV